MRNFTKDSLRHFEGLAWQEFAPKNTIKALRVDGPFQVENSEGTFNCEDGWLVVNSNGEPYPISAQEFEILYDEIYSE